MALIQISGMCDLDLGDMTFGQGHDISSSHRQQLCEILSRSNMAVRSYGPDTDFWYVCTMTLTWEIGPWVKVMSRRWVMDNKYNPDPTWQLGVMTWTQVCLHYDLDLGGTCMTLGQDHGTPLGNGQQLCEILSSSNFAVQFNSIQILYF